MKTEMVTSSQIEMMQSKSTKIEMKNLLEELDSRFELEERVSEKEDRSIETLSSKEPTIKRIKKNEAILRDLWNTVKQIIIQVIVVAEEEERENEAERVFEAIMVKTPQILSET
jgi:hypothetical protein